jgi:hypothetical protein
VNFLILKGGREPVIGLPPITTPSHNMISEENSQGHTPAGYPNMHLELTLFEDACLILQHPLNFYCFTSQNLSFFLFIFLGKTFSIVLLLSSANLVNCNNIAMYKYGRNYWSHIGNISC